MKSSSSSALVLALAWMALAAPARSQEDDSVFDAAVLVLRPEVGAFRRMLDFDLDGDPDAVGLRSISDNSEYHLYSYRNDGQGGFANAGYATGLTHALGDAPMLIEVGTLNADGWPDVCIVYRSERHDWYGLGNGHFTEQPPIPLAEDVQAMALADLDHDGIDDLVWMSSRSLNVRFSSGPSESIPSIGAKHSVHVIRANGPYGSAVLVTHALNDVRIFYRHPATGLVAGPVFATGMSGAMVDTGDIDGDGDIDAVVFGASSYRVLRRISSQSWTLAEPELGGPAEFLRDADGDGDLDGVCCGGGGGGGPSYSLNKQPTDFEISWNDGTGRFAPAFPIHGVGSPQLAGVLDVDNDGDIDLVAGRCVFYAKGPLRTLPAEADVPPQHGPRALSDCDGDGDIDVGFSVGSVYENDGEGHFAWHAPAVTPAPQGTRYRGPGYSGDFDGDGDTDLVVELGRDSAHLLEHPGSVPGHESTRTMVLLRNAGQGSLLPAVPATDRGAHFALDSDDPELSLLSDIDLDGDLDLLVRTQSALSGETRLWANDGTGRFTPGGRVEGGRVLWVGDVDLDGDADVILAGAGYGGTSTYLYLGSNALPGRLPTLGWDSRAGYWPQRAETNLEAVDFDQNGYPDFASVLVHTTNAQSPSFPQFLAFNNRFASGGSLVRNDGLSVPTPLADGARVALADLDHSGTIDALVGPLADEPALISEVLRNSRVGAVNYQSFVRVRQLMPAGLLVDLDGDGDADLLGSRIVLNRSLP